jgi:hypothetical protein
MIKRYLKRDNPWELLALAAMLFCPGLVMVLQKSASRPSAPLLAAPQLRESRRYVVGLSSTGAHFFGFVATAFSVLFVLLYFYVRRTSTLAEGG